MASQAQFQAAVRQGAAPALELLNQSITRSHIDFPVASLKDFFDPLVNQVVTVEKPPNYELIKEDFYYKLPDESQHFLFKNWQEIAWLQGLLNLLNLNNSISEQHEVVRMEVVRSHYNQPGEIQPRTGLGLRLVMHLGLGYPEQFVLSKSGTEVPQNYELRNGDFLIFNSITAATLHVGTKKESTRQAPQRKGFRANAAIKRVKNYRYLLVLDYQYKGSQALPQDFLNPQASEIPLEDYRPRELLPEEAKNLTTARSIFLPLGLDVRDPGPGESVHQVVNEVAQPERIKLQVAHMSQKDRKIFAKQLEKLLSETAKSEKPPLTV